MVESKIIHIPFETAILSLESDEVGFAKFQGGAYAFVFTEKRDISIVVPFVPADAENFAAAIQEVRDEFPDATLFSKLIGDNASRSIAKSALSQKGISVQGEAEVKDSGTKLYFVASLGRIRVEGLQPESKTPVAVATPARKKRILIVDDSNTMRRLLKGIIDSDPEMEVVAETERPTQAEQLVRDFNPDLITLDIHMPEMDGITLLKLLKSKFTVPIVMISSVSREEGINVMNALELGAVDYIEKPTMDKLDTLKPLLLEKLKVALTAKVPTAPLTATAVTKMPCELPLLIGSSTGGTEALRVFLTALPAEIPPILIVQHIPAVFSEALAKRLNDLCAFEVREAKHGDGVKPNQVLIAPGGLHMTVRGGIKASTVQLSEKPDGFRHKPAVDVLFQSALKTYGSSCIAMILTGMGTDGAEGMLALRKAGVHTIGQDKESCVVYGMPRAAMELGAVDIELPLDKIPGYLSTGMKKKRKAA